MDILVEWTYRYSREQRFDKDVILRQKGKHLGIIRDINKDRKGILRYRLYPHTPTQSATCRSSVREPGDEKKAQLTA